MTPPTLYCLLVGEHAGLHARLLEELRQIERYSVLRHAPDWPSFSANLDGENPDLVLLDATVAYSDAWAIIRIGRQKWPDAEWIIFNCGDPEAAQRSLVAAGFPELKDRISGADDLPSQLHHTAKKIRVRQQRDGVTEPAPAETGRESRSPFGQAVVDRRSGRILRVNATLAGWLGSNPADLVGRTLQSLHPASSVPDIPAVLSTLDHHQPAPAFEVSFHRGGATRFAEAIPSVTGREPPSAATVHYVDTSAHHAAERRWRQLAALIAAPEHGREFFRNTVRGLVEILHVDMACVVLAAPGKPVRLLAFCDRGVVREDEEVSMEGYPFAEVLRHRLVSVDRAFRKKYPAAERLVQAGVESYIGLQLTAWDGTPLGVLEIKHRAPLKKIRDLLAALQFVAERTKFELHHLQSEAQTKSQIECLNRQSQLSALGALSTAIAHDLNNLLNPIVGLTGLARSQLPSDHVTQEYLADMEIAGSRARDLVQQIMNFGRQSARGPAPTHLQPLVLEARSILKASAGPTVMLKTDLCAEGWQVLADPTRLHQLVMNLGTNAWHALAGQPGSVEFSVTEAMITPETARLTPGLAAGNYVCLTVTDSGTGMDAATRARIFQPFFTTKPPGQGNGIGLAVVQCVVRECAGAIQVDSAPGQGTSFRIFLPAVTESLPAPTSAALP